MVDFFLWLDVLPQASTLVFDVLILLLGIVIMGIGGGMYNAARIGSGPRDGFMLAISVKLGYSISRVRMIVERIVLLVALLTGRAGLYFYLYFFIHTESYFPGFLQDLYRMD